MTLSDSWEFWVLAILVIGLPLVRSIFKMSRGNLVMAVILIACRCKKDMEQFLCVS